MNENNISAAYKLAEFAVLSTWADLHTNVRASKYLNDELLALRMQWTDIANSYHVRIARYYNTEEAFASVLPESLLVAERVWEELGRLSLHANHWASLGVVTEHPVPIHYALWYVTEIKTLLETHESASSPPYDHHSSVIHATLAALLMANERVTAEKWLENLMHRLAYAARSKKHWPLSCDFEEAFAIRLGSQEATEEASKVSTVVPVLLIWAAAFAREDLYNFMVDNVIPAVPTWCTVSMWSSDAGYEASMGQDAYSSVGEHLFRYS